MPLFEYRCDKCGREFEELVRSVQAGNSVSCPVCQSKKVTKKFSTFGVASAAPEHSCPSGTACRSCPHAGPMCGVE